jgi:hypothetical protein
MVTVRPPLAVPPCVTVCSAGLVNLISVPSPGSIKKMKIKIFGPRGLCPGPEVPPSALGAWAIRTGHGTCRWTEKSTMHRVCRSKIVRRAVRRNLDFPEPVQKFDG